MTRVRSVRRYYAKQIQRLDKTQIKSAAKPWSMDIDSTSDDNRPHDDNPEPKRKRLAQACDIKCDGVRPTCANCIKTGRECMYNPNVKKRGPRQGYIEMLERRLDKMEKMLSRGNESSSSHHTYGNHSSIDSPASEESSSPIFSGNTHQSQPGLLPHAVSRNSHEMSGMDDGQTLGSSVVYSKGKQLSPAIESALPPIDVILHLVHLYFEYIYSYASIFDKETLILDIQEQRCPEFLVLAILSVSARYSDRPDICEEPPWHSGEKYASKARSMVITAIDNPCLANTQALYLLTLHEYGCARGPRSWMYSGMAVRMSLDIGLNRDPTHKDADTTLSTARWTEHEVQRRIFKLVNCRQFYTESMTGETRAVFNVRAPSGSNLPGVSVNISRSHFSAPDVNGSTDLHLSYYAIIHRGTSILGKITNFINRKSRQRKLFTPEGPGSAFAQLDQEIETWLGYLPPDLKYTSHNINRIRHGQMPEPGRFQLLHVLYNTMIVLLHRPALALLDSLNDQSEPNQRKWFAASAAKCMQAVENVTELVSYIKDSKVLISPFLTYLTYTVATIVVNNIFFGKPDEINKSRSALKEHFILLQNMRSYWAMADKLYFMIRDFYAMHTNYLRQQQQQQQQQQRQEDETQTKNTQVVEGQWKRATSSSIGAISESSVRHQWPMRLETTPGIAIEPFADYSTSQQHSSDVSLRGNSLIDLSLSTSDGISGSNWILGDHTKSLASSIQSLGRIPAPYSAYFDVPNMSFEDAIPGIASDTSSNGVPQTTSSSATPHWSPFEYNGSSPQQNPHRPI
ncbi:fungal-specific transcription factor domain-containing protein [Dichotomocladium elegans]|nr:fungal-specific transcription factor domain-containing protein [Dichotomocladium elegans]